MAADLTTAEAAAELDVQPDTVKHYIRRGLLAGTKRGRDWFVSRAALDAFKASRRKPGRPASQ